MSGIGMQLCENIPLVPIQEVFSSPNEKSNINWVRHGQIGMSAMIFDLSVRII